MLVLRKTSWKYVRPGGIVLKRSQYIKALLLTSLIEVAKLGDGLDRPSMLLLLLYGLGPVCVPIIDCSPRMLPRLRVVRRSDC
jgi:hypothetical protein